MNAQNPFARYGYKVKIATMSNGKFEEFHDASYIAEIGSIRFDTRTNKIVDFVKEDSIAFKTNPHIVSRFVSIDPHAEKYYSISPYAYCANNPIKFIDPDGKKIIAVTTEAQRMILNTIPINERQYVSFDKDGYINTDILSDVKSNSGNFNSLRSIANANQTMEVRIDNKFDYVNSKGEQGSRTMPYLGVDESFIGNSNGKGVGNSKGETGFLGKTLFPDKNGQENSPTNNIIVVINSDLTEEGKAQTYSHEANGHALFYIVTNDRKAASHNYIPGGKDANRELYDAINRAINETIENMK